MRINLQEIPENGLEYNYSNKTGELNEILKDLIGNLPFQVDFRIQPTARNTYMLTGNVVSELPEQCSRCGLDFNFAVKARFSELLIPRQPQPRGSQYTKPNHFSDLGAEGPTVVEYDGHHFEIGEYIHEAIALEVPFQPKAPVNSKDECLVCHVNVKTTKFTYEEALPEEKPSPFAVLKNMKLN
jgi:uncharacterized protein